MPSSDMLMTVRERIENQIEINIYNCWVWQGATNDGTANGYGNIKILGEKKLVHRVYWEIINGCIPKDMCVCHHCDNPPCINPEHLFLGTHTDNMRDKTNKGRHHSSKKQQCKHGHPFDENNTRISTHNNNKKQRVCRTCRKQVKARHIAKKKAANG